MKKLVLASKNDSSKTLYNILSDADSDNPNPILAFLAKSRIDQLNTIFHPDSVKKHFKEIETLRDIWSNILVDAIYFLRINDHREKAFYENSEKKTTMRSERADKTAEPNVYGINDLFEYFKQFSKFESTLYGADKYYRDHLVHPILVWIIGLHILRTYGQNFTLRVSDFVKIENADCAQKEWFESDDEKHNLDLKLSTAELSAMWTIIALTHDLGYPLEKVEKINDQLEQMLHKFGTIGFTRSRFRFETQHDHLIRFLLKFISSVAKPIEKGFGGTYIRPKKTSKPDPNDKYRWVTHTRTKYYTKFSKSWEMFDHGIVSSLILLKSLTFFIESDHSSDFYEKLKKEDARQFSIRSEILHSIAAHTTRKIYHLATNNLPFLLILCDELQEWSRPTLGDMRLGIVGSAKKVSFEQIEMKEDNSKIHCLIEYEDLEYEDQKSFADRAFKKWLERFRPALDDKKRRIDFSWKLKFGGNADWQFHLDTNEDVFKTPKTWRPKEGQPTIKEEYDLFENR